VPEGSHIIPNPVGTAPAFISETHDIPIICLPGVPRELEYLLGENVIPWIKRRFELDRHTLIYRVLKAVGIGESKVDRLIGDLIRPGANPEVGLLASMGEIKIRIAARAANQREAEGLIKPVESEIRNRLNHKIYGQDEDSLEGVVNAMLTAGGLSLAILETFSGASVAGRLHRIPCKMLLESRIITEEPQLKAWLGQDMDDETTPDLARTAAHRMRKNVRADVGLAILGFARETGRLYSVRGSVAVAGKGLGSSFSWEMGGDLFTLQQRAGVIGLNTLRLALLKSKNRGQSLTSPS
jgi:nicotinamide-nucleotide amidase